MGQDLYKIVNSRLAAEKFCVDVLGASVEIVSMRFIYYKDFFADPTYSQAKHRHTFYEAHVFLEGGQTYQVGDCVEVIQPGEVWCTAPGVYHSILEQTSGIKKYVICFAINGSNYDDSLVDRIAAFKQKQFMAAKDTHDLQQIFNLILTEVFEADTGWREAVSNLINILILKLVRMMEPIKPISEPLDGMSENEQRMVRAERFIKDNLISGVACADVAKYLHLSVRQLNRDSVNQYGMTMKRYIDTIRYERAMELIRNSTLSLSRIGQEVGFKETSDFQRFFKRMGGVSPGQYMAKGKEKKG